MSNDQHNDRPAASGAGSKTMAVLDALRAVVPQGLEGDLVSLGCIKDLSIQGSTVKFALALPDEIKARSGSLKMVVEQALKDFDWVDSLEITDAEYVAPAATPPPAPPAEHDHGHEHSHGPDLELENALPNVKYVIAVGSGKGGVGKSTVSVNLALALAAEGHKVGLLDADVYGPSVPLMLGVSGQPMATGEDKIQPMFAHGLSIMSMGFLLEPGQAVVWRGPMVHGVVTQFIKDVDWGELDYLIIDLPPGTGDAPMSLIQALPFTASVVVTTPQEVAAAVAEKAMSMFEKMNISVLGIIENMSYFTCPHCDEAIDIFGRGGGKVLAGNAQVPFLGEIPIDTRMRKGSDVGKPVVVEFPESELTAKFKELARRLAHVVETT